MRLDYQILLETPPSHHWLVPPLGKRLLFVICSIL